MADFGGGIDVPDTEEGFEIFRRGVLEGRDAVVRVAPVVRIVDGGLERFANGGRRHLVRLAHAEVEQFHIRMGVLGGVLGALDLLKLVNLGRGPEGLSADAVCV